MVPFELFKRRIIIPVAGLLLVVYYSAVLVPLAHRAESLNEPLETAWKKLSVSMELTNVAAIDFLHITNQVTETHQAIVLLENARQKAAARLDLSPTVRGKMNALFQLVDYQGERQRQLDEISKLAKQSGVTLEPAVLAGFPEHTADMVQPGYLWAALSLVENLLRTALQCKVSAIHSLDVPLALTNEPPANPAVSIIQIPLQIELTGPAASVLKLIQSLPLRADEMHAAGSPEAQPDKPPLFVDRLTIRKQSPDKPDEVRVSLRALGFVLRE